MNNNNDGIDNNGINKQTNKQTNKQENSSMYVMCVAVVSHSEYWFYTVANPARRLLTKGEYNKKESLAAHLPPPPRCSLLQ